MTNQASDGSAGQRKGSRTTVPKTIADLNASSDRRVLLSNACVISMDPKVGDFVTADVLIEGDTIAQVGPESGCRPGR